ILVMLDEVVVRIPRERQRIEAQGVDTWKLKQTEFRIRRLEMRYIESDQIVAEQELRAVGKLIEAAKCLLNVAVPMSHGFAGTAADGGKLEDAPGLASDLEIDRQTTRSKFLCSRRDRGRSTHYPARLDDAINGGRDTRKRTGS
ncbi:MAG TPA: hypothetical protein VLA81_10365, partial [Burkholderiales bacterium]|nr:hypothetical protein [Burkholderiales bacterium]